MCKLNLKSHMETNGYSAIKKVDIGINRGT